MKVTLRQKKKASGDVSLYLDYYPPIPHPKTSQPTRREFLKLYLYGKPKSQLDREHNKETKILAEGIRAKRQLAIQSREYGFLAKDNQDVDFVKYFTELAEKRKDSKNNYNNWRSTLNYLKLFAKERNLTIKNITPQVCEDFKEFLRQTKSHKSEKKKLSQNSQHSYFNKFLATLKRAYKDGLLKEDIAGRVDHIKPAEVRREYLTLEELQLLAKTHCDDDLLKRAALFSALTGLRWSDIEKLTWKDIQHSTAQGGYFIPFTQKKTKGVEWLPISDTARQLLGDVKEPERKIFHGLVYSAFFTLILKRWTTLAGIFKTITFHSFRHTFATLQLTEGIDIYTISKMLGHKNVRTTQIYTKVIDSKKREAANKIKLDL